MALITEWDAISSLLDSNTQRLVMNWLLDAADRAAVDRGAVRCCFDTNTGALHMEFAGGLGQRDAVVVDIDREGECIISAPALHAGFYAPFCLVQEPNESLGDADDAVGLLDQIARGNVYSRLVSGPRGVIVSEDYVLAEDGKKVLISKHTDVGRWLSSIGAKKHTETRRSVLAAYRRE